MRLCLDEHYSAQIATDLRDRGHNVVCVSERSDLRGQADDEVFDILTSERCALLAENVADFAPLVQRKIAAGETHYGVIYSSPQTMPRSRSTIGAYVRTLDSLLRKYPGEDDFANGIAWLSP